MTLEQLASDLLFTFGNLFVRVPIVHQKIKELADEAQDQQNKDALFEGADGGGSIHCLLCAAIGCTMHGSVGLGHGAQHIMRTRVFVVFVVCWFEGGSRILFRILIL
ncbi:hypothetical protein D3C80_1751030 [compost metagenome]